MTFYFVWDSGDGLWRRVSTAVNTESIINFYIFMKKTLCMYIITLYFVITLALNYRKLVNGAAFWCILYILNDRFVC